MKARLLEADDRFTLLLASGRIIIYDDLSKVRDYLENYYSSRYDMNPTWPHDLPMEDFEGDTIAIVDDEGHLVIYNGPRYTDIMKAAPILYLTVAEYAEKYGKGTSIVTRLCRDGRLPGVINKNGVWLIPADTPYPKDARVGKRV